MDRFFFFQPGTLHFFTIESKAMQMSFVNLFYRSLNFIRKILMLKVEVYSIKGKNKYTAVRSAGHSESNSNISDIVSESFVYALNNLIDQLWITVLIHHSAGTADFR